MSKITYSAVRGTLLAFVTIYDIASSAIHYTFIFQQDVIKVTGYTLTRVIHTICAAGITSIIKILKILIIFYHIHRFAKCLDIEVAVINVAVYFISNLFYKDII